PPPGLRPTGAGHPGRKDPAGGGPALGRAGALGGAAAWQPETRPSAGPEVLACSPGRPSGPSDERGGGHGQGGPVPAACDSCQLQGPGIIWRPEREVGERSERRSSAGRAPGPAGGGRPAVSWARDTPGPAPAWLPAAPGRRHRARGGRACPCPPGRAPPRPNPDRGFCSLGPGFPKGGLPGNGGPGAGGRPRGLVGVRPRRANCLSLRTGGRGSRRRHKDRGERWTGLSFGVSSLGEACPRQAVAGKRAARGAPVQASRLFPSTDLPRDAPEPPDCPSTEQPTEGRRQPPSRASRVEHSGCFQILE
ncbi:translation initiation factor IF-2-like, partial [Physeter macrocephalus]|uniref:Translation initiation factor IF-2-like n=1 Tax=Physeter macrocephalus TaxID=9755 RepID=A0A455BDV7_PHYMC